jgi:hypothetical protein
MFFYMKESPMFTERTAERELMKRLQRIRERAARITGINLNTPYPFTAPALGGFTGGIAGYALGRRYDVPDYLAVPAGFLTGMMTGDAVNKGFAYDNDKISSLRTRVRIRKLLNDRRYSY